MTRLSTSGQKGKPDKCGMARRATFSVCGLYRYSLTRQWGDGRCLLVIGLNPSTADDQIDDPTIRRCIGFAKSWGFSKLVMANLFAYRSTDPTGLEAIRDPIGPRNDSYLKRLSGQSDLALVAWGVRGSFMDRNEAVLAWLPEPHCLGRTKAGCPRHPLYVHGTAQPRPYLKA